MIGISVSPRGRGLLLKLLAGLLEGLASRLHLLVRVYLGLFQGGLGLLSGLFDGLVDPLACLFRRPWPWPWSGLWLLGATDGQRHRQG